MSALIATNPAEKSAAIYQQAREVLPSGYTRQLAVQKPHPFYAARAEGPWVWDVDGNKRIDFVNNFTALIHGHSHPEIVSCIQRQAGELMSVILPSEWEVKLGRILCDRIPSVERVRFMNSGTEAVMIAVKAARAYTGKPMIAKMEGGYHGQYDLIEASHRPLPDQWGPEEAPTSAPHNVGTPQSLLDEVLVLPVNNIEATRTLLRAHADKLSCVLIDPYRIHLGNISPREDYLALLREETENLGIVLIFDEVMCLRVGYHGRQGQVGITPDLTTMGKIIGGGLPIGALGGQQKFMSVFEVDEGDPKVKHSGTFTANPMSLAAGVTGMSLLTPEVFADLNQRGDTLRDGLEKALQDSGLPGRVVGKGALNSILLQEHEPQNYREMLMMFITDGYADKLAHMQKLFMDHGIITMRASFVGSTPMTDDDIDFTIDAAKRVFAQMH